MEGLHQGVRAAAVGLESALSAGTTLFSTTPRDNDPMSRAEDNHSETLRHGLGNIMKLTKRVIPTRTEMSTTGATTKEVHPLDVSPPVDSLHGSLPSCWPHSPPPSPCRISTGVPIQRGDRPKAEEASRPG